jgi:hypothetical protein
MARIPTQEELGGVQYAVVRSQPQYRAQDFAAEAQAGRALAQAGEAVGKVGARVSAKLRQDDDYEVQKRLIDFDLEREKDLDDSQRSTQPEARDFTSSYRSRYDEAARRLMEDVPAHLKPNVDKILVERGARFEKRAYDFELKERDRYHVEDVNRKLTDIYNDSTAAPDRWSDNAQRGVALIRSSRLPVNTKLRSEREFLERNDEYAARARLDAAKTPEDREAILDQIKRMPRAQAEQIGQRVSTVRFSPEVEAAVGEAAERHGFDPGWLKAYTAIESSGDPAKRTGRYKGLLMLSDEQFKEHGGTGNIYDPRANADAGAAKLRIQFDAFQSKYGRPPEAHELYLVHQQGEGGFAAHQSKPDAPAWQNMAGTAEGRQKGEGWAKKAIWGNIPDAQKAQFGSVDNVTSADFMKLWLARVERGLGGGYTMPDQPPGGGQPAGPLDDPRDEPVEADDAPYRHLSPTKRRVLLNIGRNLVRADAVGVVNGAIEKVRNGDELEADANGRTSFDRSVEHMAPQQKREAVARMETARLYAGVVRGAGDTPTEEIDARIHELAVVDDVPDEARPARRRALEDAIALRNRLKTLRENDGPLAVQGDEKLRLKPAREIIEAARKAKEIDPNDPHLKWKQKAILLDARIEAQKRTSPDAPPRLLTKSEVSALIQMPKGEKDYTITDKRFGELLERAADRAYKAYGPENAKRVLTEAINRTWSGDVERQSATGRSAKLLAQMAMGEPVTADDLRRLRLEREADFRFGGDAEAQPGGFYGQPAPTLFQRLFGGAQDRTPPPNRAPAPKQQPKSKEMAPAGNEYDQDD